MSNDRIAAMVELADAMDELRYASARHKDAMRSNRVDGSVEERHLRAAAERLDKALSAWYYGGASGQITTARATTPFMTRVTAQLINEKARGMAGDAEGGR